MYEFYIHSKRDVALLEGTHNFNSFFIREMRTV